MKKLFLLTMLLPLFASAQRRWADTVLNRSSEYGGCWAASQILGQPNVYPTCADVCGAYTPSGVDVGHQWIELAFQFPAPVNNVRIYETSAAGSIDSVYIWNPDSSSWVNIYAATPAATTCRILNISFPTTSYNVNRVRFSFNSDVPGWNEFDAVGISNIGDGGLIAGDQTVCAQQTPSQLSNQDSAYLGNATVVYQWQDSTAGGAWQNIGGATSADFQPGLPSQSTWFRRKATIGGNSAYSNIITVIKNVLPNLAPGNNEWIFYGFAGYDVTPSVGDALGRYTRSSVSFNTFDDWNGNGAPSWASGWTGCSMPTDFFTLVGKRKGFPPGPYTMQLPGYDDLVRVFKNGNQIFANNGTGLFSIGYLGANDSLEVRLGEWGGGAGVVFNLSQQPLSPGSIGYDAAVCDGESYSISSLSLAYGGSANFSYQWQDSVATGNWQNIAGATNASYTTPALSVTTWYRRQVTDDSSGIAISNTVRIAANTTSGNPAQPGNGEWNFYVFSGYDLNLGGTYRGYYTRTGLSFNTLNDWCGGCSPADASGYQGCPQGPDNFSLSAKRKGFSAGPYILQVNGHDDGIRIYKNSVQLYEYNGCCSTNPLLSLGDLGPDDTIEVRLAEGPGGAYVGAIIQEQQLSGGTINGAQQLCGNQSPSQLGNQQPAYGGHTVLFNYQWQDSTAAGNWQNISGATNTTFSPPVISQTTWYRRHVYDGLDEANSNIIELTHYALEGNPSVFGQDQWHAYVYNGGDISLVNNSYRGFYTESGLNFNSQNYWNGNGAPSSATGYQGCPSQNDNMTVVYKRKGFPPGNYSLNVGHDDQLQIFKNGSLIYNVGCCPGNSLVNLGILKEDSTIEMRLVEGGGYAYLSGTFNALPFDTATISITASDTIVCEGGQVIFNASITNGGTNPQFQWTNNGTPVPSATSDSYTHTVVTGSDQISCVLTSNLSTVVFDEVESNHITIHATTRPTVQASNLMLSNVSATGMKISFTRGNGNAGAIVVVKQDSPFIGDPDCGSTLTASSASVVQWSDTIQTMDGGKVVYATSSNGNRNFTLKNLHPTSRYYVRIYELSTSAYGPAYLSPAAETDVTLPNAAPTKAASLLQFSEVTGGSFKAQWKNGNGNGRIVIMKALTGVSSTPADSSAYTADAIFGQGTAIGGDNFVVFKGSDSSVTVTGLRAGTKYALAIHEYNGNDPYLDFANNALKGTITTAIDYISLSKGGVAYTEGFNGLAVTGTSNALPFGWSLAESGAGADGNLTASDGSIVSDISYSYGNNGSGDRALGTLGSSAFGIKLRNTSKDTFTSVLLVYRGEQWRKGGSTTTNDRDTVRLAYGYESNSLTDGGYINVPALSFPSVQTGAAGALDGNAVTNSRKISASVKGLNWIPGGILWLRFTDLDVSGNEDGLAVDDVTIVPFRNTVVSGGVLSPGTYNDLNLVSGNVALSSNISVKYGLNIEDGSSLDISGWKLTLKEAVYGTGSMRASADSTDTELVLANTGLTVPVNFDPAANYLKSLIVSGNSGATLTGEVNIIGSPKPGAVKVGLAGKPGILYTNGYLNLLSDSLGTAGIGSVYGTVNGNVNVHRWLQSRPGVRLLSHPFSTSIPLLQLNDDLSVSVSSGSENAWFYDNTSGPISSYNDLASAAAWTPYSALVSGWARGSAIRLKKTETASVTASLSGAVNTGDQNLSLNSGPGSKLTVVGNPYPAGLFLGKALINGVDGPIDLGAISGTAIWTWDPTRAAEGAFVTIPAAKIPSSKLPICGAFVAELTNYSSSAVIHLDEKMKTTTTSTKTVFRPASDVEADEDIYMDEEENPLQLPQGLQLIVSKAGKYFDATYLYFDEHASAAIDAANDARKLGNPGLNLYSISSEQKPLSVDTRSFEPGCFIDLGLDGAPVGTYAIQTADWNIPAGLDLYLVDKQTGNEQLLTGKSSYTFNVDGEPGSQGKRFRIRMAETSGTLSESLHVSPNPAKAEIRITLAVEESKEAVVRILSITGTEMIRESARFEKGTAHTMQVDRLIPGSYIVEVMIEGRKLSTRFIKE